MNRTFIHSRNYIKIHKTYSTVTLQNFEIRIMTGMVLGVYYMCNWSCFLYTHNREYNYLGKRKQQCSSFFLINAC